MQAPAATVKEVNGLHTIEGDLSGSPLYNKDIAPTTLEQRHWTKWNIAALWVGMSVCIPTYMLASSLISDGMNWWQAVLTVALGNVIVLIPMVLNAHAGTKYGITFPVFARASFGTLGANIPGILRAIVACGWFGIQTWIGGKAIYVLALQAIPGLSGAPAMGFLGINVAQFVCFMIFWALNVWIFWRGMESIRAVEDWGAPLLILIGIALLIWAYVKADGFGPMLSQPSQFEPGQPKEGQFWKVFFPGLTAMVGFWATLSLNIPDFTRMARSQKDQILGQALGLNTTMPLYAFIGVAVTSATVVVYGEAIWNPIDLMARFDSVPVILISMFALGLATLTTNLAANVVAPATSFSNIAPRKISLRVAGLITGIIGIVMMPWKLAEHPGQYIYTWLIGYSALLGPIGGVLICDYFFIRRTRLNVVGLYDPRGEYSYNGGFNPIAVFSLVMGIAPNIPGFIGTVKPSLAPAIGPFLMSLYNYAWFVGFFISFFAYGGFMTVAGKVKTVK
jgi:NCS1 family nucleobase:cation symporter-1